MQKSTKIKKKIYFYCFLFYLKIKNNAHNQVIAIIRLCLFSQDRLMAAHNIALFVVVWFFNFE